MRKNKIVIFIIIEIILLTIFIMLMETTQAKEQQAKSKLEQAVNKSYIQDKLDAQSLKNNIEKEIKGASIPNKQTTQFPVQAVVDGYEFQIEENGNIESADIMEDTNQMLEDIENIVKYQNETKSDKGITIETTKDGLVTISGKSTEKLFVKISNNIQISDNAKDFEKWKQDDGIIIESGTRIEEKVSIINNEVSNGQVNIALRTEENEAIGIIKLAENQTEYTAALNKNVIANYVYIEKGVDIKNMKFKVQIIEKESKHEQIQLLRDSKIDKGIECKIDDSGVIELNGTSTDKLYIKISNGMQISSDGNFVNKIAISEPILFDKEENLRIDINEINGKVITENAKQEFNVAIRYQDGEIATKCLVAGKQLSQEVQLIKDATLVYLYISSGVTFENYKITVDFK